MMARPHARVPGDAETSPHPSPSSAPLAFKKTSSMATDPSGPDHSSPSDSIPSESNSSTNSDPTSATASDPETTTDLVDQRRKRRIGIGARVLLFTIGWALVLIGIAGLVLPGIQGILTILLGAAILSAVSELIYEWLKRLLKRWPSMLDRLENFRESVRGRFGRD